MIDDARKPIDAVLFDYGLVLSGPPSPEAWARMRTVMDVGEEALQAGYWADRHDYDRGTLNGTAYWHSVARHAGRTLDAAQVGELIEADTELWTQPNPPMVEWAARLQRAGVKTGILSNLGDAMAEGVCAKFDWLSGFDHCTWSHALFLAKPELEIYLRTAESLKTPVEKILFVDDRADNIAAAHAVGMQTIRYTGHEAFEQEMRDRGLGRLLEAEAMKP